MKKQSWPAMLFRSMGNASPDHLSHSQKCLTMGRVGGRNSEQRVRMVVAEVEDESCPIGRRNAWRRLPKPHRRPCLSQASTSFMAASLASATAASLGGTINIAQSTESRKIREGPIETHRGSLRSLELALDRLGLIVQIPVTASKLAASPTWPKAQHQDTILTSLISSLQDYNDMANTFPTPLATASATEPGQLSRKPTWGWPG